jgi:hypothetical protein
VGYGALKSATSVIGNVAIGHNSMCAATGNSNTAVGQDSLIVSTGVQNVAVGCRALMCNAAGFNNVGVGVGAGFATTTGCWNTSLGFSSLIDNISGCYNVALGAYAGLGVTGGYNVTIGNSVAPASLSGSCQLAIGFGSGQNWLTGCSDKSIRPGAGIRDCTGSTGTVGQVLTSTGSNALQWAAPSAGSKPYIALRGTQQTVTNQGLHQLTFSVIANNGFVFSGNTVALTANKAYRISAQVAGCNFSVGQAGCCQIPFYLMCAGVSTTIPGFYGQVSWTGSVFTQSSSFDSIFVPTVNTPVAICAGYVTFPTMSGTYFSSMTSWVVQEI